METIYERVGALDAHKAQVTTCVRVPDSAGRREPHLAEFSTTVAGLVALRDWLAAHRVTHVAMEATGVYSPGNRSGTSWGRLRADGTRMQRSLSETRARRRHTNMTLVIAFVAGGICTALLLYLTRRHTTGAPLPQLVELQEAVRQIRVDQRGESGELRGLVRGIVEQQEQLARQTGQLSEALRRPGIRGQWGETTLRRVVEAAGLAEHFDFDTQTHVAGDGEQQAVRPDLVINLPGRGCVPVDAKVPLDAYLDAAAADTPVLRDAALDEHVKHVRAKVRELAGKAYWRRFERAPEMVVMFVASEAAFAAAVQRDPLLLEDAAHQRVVIATPATMLALLQVVQLGWREHALSENTEQVRGLATELIGRLGTFTGHLAKVGKALEQAAKAHNQAVGSLETRVLATARKFDALGIPGEVSETEPVTTIPRLPAGELEELTGLDDAA